MRSKDITAAKKARTKASGDQEKKAPQNADADSTPTPGLPPLPPPPPQQQQQHQQHQASAAIAPLSAGIVDTFAGTHKSMSVSALPMQQLYPFADVQTLGMPAPANEQPKIPDDSAGSDGCHISAEYANSGNMQKDWIQAFMTQPSAPPALNAENAPLPLGHQQQQEQQSATPAARDSDDQGAISIPSQHSDSDSDDISRSLSIFLTQQLQQHQHQHQQQPLSKRLPAIGLLPHGGDYAASLEDILGFGIDGSRRVISMPNPINNLSLDVSHAQSLIGIPMVSGLGIDKSSADGSAGHPQLFEPPFSANPAGTPSAMSYHPPVTSSVLPTVFKDNNDTTESLLCFQSDICTMPVACPTADQAKLASDICSQGGFSPSPMLPGIPKSAAPNMANSCDDELADAPAAGKKTKSKLNGDGTAKPSATDASSETAAKALLPKAKRGRPPLGHKKSSYMKTNRGAHVHDMRVSKHQLPLPLSLPLPLPLPPPPPPTATASPDMVPLATKLHSRESSVAGTPAATGPSMQQANSGSGGSSSGNGLVPSMSDDISSQMDRATNTTADMISRISTPMHTPSLPSSTPTSMVSSLIPHRVDRQLAASASRPLLFVRPRMKDEPPRRRKRRCVSSNPSLPASALDEMSSGDFGIKKDEEAPMDGQTTLQWQRISEQRRRDAMRENFDLLKRMLPQAYMASDDGRELARPVLLARFLRWVDDTLIEMENLKSEVAHLRLLVQGSGSCSAGGEQPPHQRAVKINGMWQFLGGSAPSQGSGGVGRIHGFASHHHHHHLASPFGQPNNLGLQGPE